MLGVLRTREYLTSVHPLTRTLLRWYQTNAMSIVIRPSPIASAIQTYGSRYLMPQI